MPKKFSPLYTITPKIASCLMRIEMAKQKVIHLPLTPKLLASLRETARLYSTHYSTQIEGNRLQPEQIAVVLKHEGHFPGRERDEYEVKGYYAALAQLEQLIARGASLGEDIIKTLHALVMAGGKTKIKPTPYRDGQNVIKNARTNTIVYMPPEAGDVPGLMKSMVDWINESSDIPCPIIASIAHYQFATIHPYYDGNGRTARLITQFIVHKGGYDLKGIYSLEEYYARNLGAYYDAISVGDSHNYYMGREQADITQWVEYFVEGMAFACESVLKNMNEVSVRSVPDHADLMRQVDPKQRRALTLFSEFDTITARQIGQLFGFKPRTSAQLCKDWVEKGFLEVADPSNKARTYRLSKRYRVLIEKPIIE